MSMTNEHQPTQQRLIIRFGKFGPMKYTSNLDLAKIWERVLRRAELPIQYSRGFNTRPRIALATALPLGITSECELLDVSLRQPVDLGSLVELLTTCSPEGLRIYEIRETLVNAPSLQPLVRSAEYRIHFLDLISADDLRARIAQLLNTDTLIRTSERKGKMRSTDLRPLIHDLHIDDNGDLIAHIAAGENGNLRTEDLLTELDLHHLAYTVHRMKLFMVDV